MKSILYIIILSVIAPLFIACSEDLNLCAQQNTVVVFITIEQPKLIRNIRV